MLSNMMIKTIKLILIVSINFLIEGCISMSNNNSLKFTFISSYSASMHGIHHITEERIAIYHNGTVKVNYMELDKSNKKIIRKHKIKLTNTDLSVFSELLARINLDEYRNIYSDIDDGPQANYSKKRRLDIKINKKRKSIEFDGWTNIPDNLNNLIKLADDFANKKD